MSEELFFELDENENQMLKEILRRKSSLLEDIERLKEDIRDVDDEIDQIEESEDRIPPQQKQLVAGKKKFNQDSKKGMAYLIECELVKNSVASVASFLFSTNGLSKTAIGDYLGEREDFNVEVLKEYVTLHDFKDKQLDVALRQFLWSFRLPGEAQKIDRMMESFASHYCLCNPGVFSNTDTCYVLSFSIIMLNTSLHNPSVRDKPSVDSFISMNRGINDGKDVPSPLLTSLYDSIKKNEFKVPEDDDEITPFFNPDKEGWLLKQGGGRYKTWKRRWFVLSDNCLFYFEYTSDKEPKGIIPLENLQIREMHDQRKPNCFEIYLPDVALLQTIKCAKTDSQGHIVEGKHLTYKFSAATPKDQDQWISCIRKSISKDPYYDMIAARKKKKQLDNGKVN